MAHIYPRWQYDALARALKEWRVVLVTGPRQCGKTTLAKSFATKNSIYRTLDDEEQLTVARQNPRLFVEHSSDLLIIDEIQHAPALLRAIKKAVDDDQRPGRFLITGSSNLRSIPSVNESLAGRACPIHLHPLALGEIHSEKPHFITDIFEQKFSASKNELNKHDLLEIALRGGFPEAIKRATLSASQEWHLKYLQLLLEQDLRDIVNIRRMDVMHQLCKALAAWSSKYIDLHALGAGLGTSRPTLETYINALEALFLVTRLPPWTKTDYGRVGKQAKLFLTDSGLMSSILGWREIKEILFNSDQSGKLIETWAFNELTAQLGAQKTPYHMYHYRDREKREIDFIIERSDGALAGIEIKSGAIVSPDWFDHLRWFKDNMAKKKPFVGIVLHTGTQITSYSHNLWAIPYSGLYSKAKLTLQK